MRRPVRAWARSFITMASWTDLVRFDRLQKGWIVGVLEMAWTVALLCVGTMLLARLGYLYAEGKFVDEATVGVSMVVWLASVYLSTVIVVQAGSFVAAWEAVCSWLRHYSSNEATAELTAGLGVLVTGGVVLAALGAASMGLGWALSAWIRGHREAKRRAASGN